jgi:hypothetical protein
LQYRVPDDALVGVRSGDLDTLVAGHAVTQNESLVPADANPGGAEEADLRRGAVDNLGEDLAGTGAIELEPIADSRAIRSSRT